VSLSFNAGGNRTRTFKLELYLPIMVITQREMPSQLLSKRDGTHRGSGPYCGAVLPCERLASQATDWRGMAPVPFIVRL
jgi:hypothetical protein